MVFKPLDASVEQDDATTAALARLRTFVINGS
jgi:hypothetical protein